MDPKIREDILHLPVRELLSQFKGILTFSREQRGNKELLVDHILASATPEAINFTRRAGARKREEMEEARVSQENGRKRKRNEVQSMRRAAQRNRDTDEPRDILKFLELPTTEQVKSCYRRFYNATSNRALESTVCGVCAREVSVQNNRPTLWHANKLPNSHRLLPSSPHPAHTLFNGLLLEPNGVEGNGAVANVRVCQSCLKELQEDIDKPPPLSLANNMWIGKVPWCLQVLTFPEQLLIALLYPRVYVFKLFPKKVGGRRDASNLQRGMRGNVSSYELSMEGITAMVEGRLMPQPPAILASVISVTFIGLGDLPKQWLRTTFRVRRHIVAEALRWLKDNNSKYYSDIEISASRLQNLPEDDVPEEIVGLVRQSTETGIIDQESDGYVPVDEEAAFGQCFSR